MGKQKQKLMIVGGAIITLFLLMVLLNIRETKKYHSIKRPDDLNFKDYIEKVNCSETDQKIHEAFAKYLSEESILKRTNNCDEYFVEMSVFADQYDVSRDASFPMAYSHLIHHQTGIFESLMATNFRRMDFHCIYIDKKASPIVEKAVKRIIKCYKERFYSSKDDGDTHLYVHDWTNPIYWGHVSVLEADLSCLRSLVEIGKSKSNEDGKWKFYMNLAGSELPLKTIAEVRNQLEGVEHGGVIEGDPLKDKNPDRLKKSIRLNRIGSKKYDLQIEDDLDQPNRPPAPFNLTAYKAPKGNVLSFEKCEFMISHQVALKYYNWIEDMYVADESFFQTLLRIEEVKQVGDSHWMVRQNLDLKPVDGVCSRSTLWYYEKCQGKNINSVCNVAAADLKPLRKLGCMIGNKFNLEVDATAVACQVKEITGKMADTVIDGKMYYIPKKA